MPGKKSALVVEDDPKIRRLLKNILEEDGFCVFETEQLEDAVAIVREERLSLVTLDVQLGGESGFDVLRAIRALSMVPIIMVTGRDDVIDRVLGLEMGADDYITKPFHVREMLARIRAVLRRPPVEKAEPTACTENDDVEAFIFDGLKVMPDIMEVQGRDNTECSLSTADFTLLKVFLDRPKRALSRDQLMDLIGGTSWSPLDRTIDNQVARLRKKIERNPAEPKLIKTVRGVGYMFAHDVVKTTIHAGFSKSA